jgi:hypothetical protein
LSFSKKGNTS